MELIRSGESPKDAMISAGYSPKTANDPKTNLLNLQGSQKIIEQYKAEYTKVGITPMYMAKKTAEWLEATKIKSSMTEPDKIVPDYPTQLKAAEFVRQDWGMINKDAGININGEKVIAILGGVSVQSHDSNDKDNQTE